MRVTVIRTIEYWDIERQRFPAYDHRAVIVAEELTARFFNIIRLLNRAVPLIAIQLNAFSFDNSRRYWEQRAGMASLAVLDHVVALVEREIGPPLVTYNKNHVALGTDGYQLLLVRSAQIDASLPYAP